MKQKTWIIILAILAAVLIAAAVIVWLGVLDVWQPAASADNNELAPDFTVYTADGAAVKLSDFKGKPVVLNFWASWCGPCKSEMPAFEQVYKTVGENVQFLMVNLTDGVNETVEVASAFIADAGYTFPVFYDTAYEANMAYGISAIPATFFIDADGCVVANHVGAMSENELQNYVNQIVQ